LHYNANSQAVSFARVLLFGFWACLTAVTPLAGIASLPRELARPIGMIALLPDAWHAALWTPTALTVVKWTLVVCSILCVLSWRAVRFAGPIACVLATAFQTLIRSYGNINHGEIGAIFGICALTIFSWLNSKERIESRQAQGFNPYTAPLLAVGVVLATAYTMIGWQRLGLESLYFLRGNHEHRVFFTHAMTAYCVAKSESEMSYAFARGVGSLIGQHRWMEFLLNAGFVVVTFFEATAWLLLISATYRYLFFIVMISFHVGSLFLMRIFFWENLILYIFLLDLSWWLGPRRVAGTHPVVLFDGVCGLCNRFVDWLLRRDDTGVLRFAPLQSPQAEQLGATANGEDSLATVIVVDNEKTYRRSTAALRTIAMLGWPWNLAKALLVVPRPLRDAVYRWVATNRYQWFGKRETCRMPTPEERSRFLE
jgi:predicted DCC family thiol-disulfide oxidoreductase YuxK